MSTSIGSSEPPPFHLRLPISSESDIVDARSEGRALAERMGFSSTDSTVIATAISEVARNIVQFARRGEILLSTERHDRDQVLVIVARDEGPGIPDVDRALEPGFSTAGSLGLGLPGAKRLMDEFELESRVGAGTTITMKKRQQ